MTREEMEAVMALPENQNRAAVVVHEDGEEFVAVWEGREFRAGNPFGLDSMLTSAGVPEPRNLFLLDRAGADHE